MSPDGVQIITTGTVMCSLVTSWLCDETCVCDELTAWRHGRVTRWPCDELTGSLIVDKSLKSSRQCSKAAAAANAVLGLDFLNGPRRIFITIFWLKMRKKMPAFWCQHLQSHISVRKWVATQNHASYITSLACGSTALVSNTVLLHSIIYYFAIRLTVFLLPKNYD